MPEVRDILVAVLTKHLPGEPHDREYLEALAEDLLMADRYREQMFQVSSDIEKLEDIARTARTLRKSLQSLDESTNDFLARLIFGPSDAEHARYQTFANALGTLEKEAETLRRSKWFKRAAGKKRNWRAIAITKIALDIWKWERWKSDNPGVDAVELWRDSDPETTIISEVEEYKPTSERYHTPGPFGRFLEEIFDALEVFGRDGQPVRAANALASLKDTERRDN